MCWSIPALLVGVSLFTVSLQRRVHPLSQQLHLTGIWQALGIFKKTNIFFKYIYCFIQSVCLIKRWIFCTWVEKDYGSKATQLCLVHLHVSHLTHKLRQNSDKYETNWRTSTKTSTREEREGVTIYHKHCCVRFHLTKGITATSNCWT